jgi:hypothetical protein
MEAQQFTAVLVKPDTIGAWTYLTVPFNAEHIFNNRARIPVKGTINGVSFQGSLMPHGNGRHYMVVNKTLQKNCGASIGDEVHVSMVLDEQERIIAVPEDLEAALVRDVRVKQLFDDFAYSHRKEYIEWIISAKKPGKQRIDAVVPVFISLNGPYFLEVEYIAPLFFSQAPAYGLNLCFHKHAHSLCDM